jgi:hypothetical protein
MVWQMFQEAMAFRKAKGEQVWDHIDRAAIESEIDEQRQFKVMMNGDVTCLFSVLTSDPHIWGNDEQGDALYLHRIVTNLAFRGQRTFDIVLQWAQQYARANEKRFIRMDTWAQNTRIIQYYQSYGFTVKRTHTTGDIPALPAQNRNLHVALLELHVHSTL